LSRHYYKISLPSMPSTTKTEGLITGWYKNEGDMLSQDEKLFEIEADGTRMDVRILDRGILSKILIRRGQNKISVGQLVALMAEQGEDWRFVAEKISDNPKHTIDKTVVQGDIQPPGKEARLSIGVARESEELPSLSPAVNHWINLYNLDFSKIKGNGPKGRILKGDVLFYIEGTGAKKPLHVPTSKTPLVGPQKASSPQTLKVENAFAMRPIPFTKETRSDKPMTSKGQFSYFYVEIECVIDELTKLMSRINRKFHDTGMT
jgi:pyruvate dehydrogenase E2 component (dihydrolipoamide acetyltransferase)